MRSIRSSLTRGFTLVEVVLALGIATIGLVSILGLLNAATDAEGSAGHDTTLVAMSDYVLNELHTTPFDALWSEDPTQNWSAAPTTGTNIPDTIFYFTNEGAALSLSEAGTNPDYLYKCVVRKTPDPNSQNILNGTYNLLKVQLDFYWPAISTLDEKPKTPPPNNNFSPLIPKKTLHVSIARH